MKTIDEVNKEIAERNRKFRGASRKQKRILIAKDIIEQLKAGKFEAEMGVYAKYGCAVDAADALNSTSLQDGLIATQQECRVCAKGAIVLSKIMFSNKVNVDVDVDFNPVCFDIPEKSDNDYAGVSAIFSPKQLELIEIAFETEIMHNHHAHEEAALSFGQKYIDADDRLIAIMNNIIKNDGTFKP